MSVSRLEHRLLEFDGVAVSILSEARMACREESGFHEELLALCFDERSAVADGATWILKAELEDGWELPSDLTDYLAASLRKLHSWQAILHVCQVVEYLLLTPAQASLLMKWVRRQAGHSRPFVRAWALHARVALGRRFKEHHDEAEQALARAEKDTAASVRARARNLRKTFKWLRPLPGWLAQQLSGIFQYATEQSHLSSSSHLSWSATSKKRCRISAEKGLSRSIAKNTLSASP